MRGNTDRPIELYENDEFQIEPYVSGLAEFIEECDTPMTIAVQGDWGCGKTSMMNMTRDCLRKNDCIVDVWFNTWQFSQFNTDEQLSITFLQHLLKELGKNINDVTVKEKLVDKISPIMKKITIGMTKQFVGSDAGDMVDELLSKAQLDIVDEISELKQNFQELITKVTIDGRKRVVVFIDDLDRLQPVRAVELLEILKLFVDCDNCIFVMAIDTSVVFQGIREKYGEGMSLEKAQSFFDKMIQLPFKMPVAHYKLDSMTKRLLTFLDEDGMSEDMKKDYVAIIRKVTNGNPRSIKRLANSILLLDKVAEKKGIYSGVNGEMNIWTRRIMVLLNCIQMKYETTYNFVVNNLNYKRMQDILGLKVPAKEGNAYGQELINKLNEIGMPNIELEDTITFFDIFSSFLEAAKKVYWTEHSITKSTPKATNRVMQVIALGNIVNDDDEKSKCSEPIAYQCKENTEEKESATIYENSGSLGKHLYQGMLFEGKQKEVYEMLVAEGLYVPLGNVIEDFNIIKEIRLNRANIREFNLFKHMDDILKQYYICDDSRISGTSIDRIIYMFPISKIDEFKVEISFDIDNRYLTVSNGYKFKFVRTMKIFEKVEEKVAAIRKEYGLLQEKYGNQIVRDKGIQGIKETTDAYGVVTEIVFENCYIINQQMADIFIDLFTYIFENKELLQDSRSVYEQFGTKASLLFDAANAVAGLKQ